MFTGLYASAAGMLAEMKNMDVISNNIANINTSGFKKDTSIFRTFYDDAVNSYNTPQTSLGTIIQNRDTNSLPVIEKTVVDFNDGVIKETGSILDIAIQGDGLFELQGTDGSTLYTRAGSFKLNSNGEVVTATGHKLMGEVGVIRLPENTEGSITANLNIDEEGNVTIGEAGILDKVSIFKFVDNSKLKKVGHSLFTNSERANVSDELFDGTIHQGYIEISNVNPVEEMANMITTSRTFDAYHRIIRAIMDDTTDKTINLVGRIR
jgi:flagellar basal-body rod protein FlgG